MHLKILLQKSRQPGKAKDRGAHETGAGPAAMVSNLHHSG
jgi:hypothetical protein